MKIISLQYRIKDNAASRHLAKMSSSVNFVWNYCNDVNQESWAKFRKMISAFDLCKMTKGCANDLGIHSQSIQCICHEYDKRRKFHKKVKLNWRSNKRSLGWVPFRGINLKIKGDSISYCGHVFKIWLSRPIEGDILCGSFSQNAKGNWFINIVVRTECIIRSNTDKECGIDLGLKTIATLSDGVSFDRENMTNKYEQKLSSSQRANKKKLTRSIYNKIKNTRRDWNHKTTSLIVREYDKIIIGNVSSSQLVKTKMAKSVQDAAWYDFKTMLANKAKRLGVKYAEVNESFSTVTCSQCGSRTGPKGQSGLKVRQWMCLNCSTTHNRDVNAAINILKSVRDI